MVLRPLTQRELKSLFDDTSMEVLKFYITKAMLMQPEKLVGQKELPIQIPKEHLEQWIVQAIGGIPVGSGSYPIDVIYNDIGIDVKALSVKTNNGKLKNEDSGETSLAQKFTGSGHDLDQLFEEEKYNDIVDAWNYVLYEKLENVSIENSLSKIYYIFILKAEKEFYLCGTEVYINEINKIELKRVTKKNVFLDGLIDDNFGNARIYKSKKRLELRLRPKYWYDNNYTINFNLDFEVESKSLRQLVEENKLQRYKEDLSDVFINS